MITPAAFLFSSCNDFGLENDLTDKSEARFSSWIWFGPIRMQGSVGVVGGMVRVLCSLQDVSLYTSIAMIYPASTTHHVISP